MSLVAIKIIIIAVNNCLDLYFHALIIEFFVICRFRISEKGTLKGVCWFVKGRGKFQ